MDKELRLVHTPYLTKGTFMTERVINNLIRNRTVNLLEDQFCRIPMVSQMLASIMTSPGKGGKKSHVRLFQIQERLLPLAVVCLFNDHNFELFIVVEKQDKSFSILLSII
jgi:hypothetical protein